MTKVLTLILALCFHTLTMTAQRQFTLEDLNFGGNRYHAMTPERRYYEWWGDELMRLDVDGIYLTSKESGKEKCVLSLDNVQEILGSEEATVGVNLLSTAFPYHAEPVAVITTPTERVAIDFRKHRKLWAQSHEGTLEWNSKSRTDAFSRDENLWLRLADGSERQLSTDGSREIVYGRSVHRNEFGITKGTFFSPDGYKLAFYRMDQSMVTDYPQVNTFDRIATHEPDKYPMAGMTSHQVTVGIHDINADKTVWLDLGDPTDRYFTNIAWAPDGKRLYLIELNRQQTVATLDEYDAATGEKLRTLETGRDEKYIEPEHPIEFLPWDAGKFVLWSQRDGFQHLYLYDAATGNCLKQLTKGDFVIQELIGFDSATKSIIVKANKDSHLCHDLYSVSVGNGSMTRIDNGKGVHSAKLSHSGGYILDTWSEPDMPKAYCLRRTATQWERALFRSPDPWKGYAVPEYRNGTIKAADGTTDLHYRMVLPPDFSQEKAYPAVLYVYGGPHMHLVEASWHWGSRGWETYMAQKGYIVFVLDSRGSELRGKAFEQATFHQLGQVEMQDQMRGVDFLTSLPYVDGTRLGVHGWSFGGFMTISLMTNYPEVFKAGVAGGPVIDWKWYEVMYGERYMGTPESNPEGYEKTSLTTKAKNLKGRLQIITGANDPVVVPQHALSFLDACNKAGTQPDFYAYPGEGHNMQGHLSVHLHERISRYFDDFLK